MTGSVERKPGSGRKRKTTEREDRILKRLALDDRKQTLPQVATAFKATTGIEINRDTVRRRLRESGIKVYQCRRKPLLSKKNRNGRKAWAMANRNQPLNYWRMVMWSDESRFCLVSDRPQKCIRRPGEQFRSDCLKTTAKFGGGGIMVWGVLSAAGVGPIVWVKSKMNSDVYIELMENYLIDAIDEMHPDDNYVYQQDGAPCHKSRKTMQWLADWKIKVIGDWPPQSPDFNIIENVWDHIGRVIEKERYSNQNELWEAVKKAWYSIKPEFIEKLIMSVPGRLEAACKNNGGAIAY